jgi:large-conductance mechanosensitive channel
MKLSLHGFGPVISSVRQIIIAFTLFFVVMASAQMALAQAPEPAAAPAASGIVAEQRPVIDNL